MCSVRIDYVSVIGIGLVSIYAFFAEPVFAHAEHDKARYVAENGKDEGRCDQTVSPCKTISSEQKATCCRILLNENLLRSVPSSRMAPVAGV